MSKAFGWSIIWEKPVELLYIMEKSSNLFSIGNTPMHLYFPIDGQALCTEVLTFIWYSIYII